MASVNKDAEGWRVLVVMPDGQRKTIRLTGLNKAKAEQVGRHIDELVQAKGSGQPIERQTALWLPTIGQKLHDKLMRAGLVAQRAAALLGDFLKEYIEKRSDVKAGTVTNYDQVRLNLIAFFGSTRPLRTVTTSDAAEFRQWLLSDERLAENTVRRRCGRARQFFTAAKRWKMIEENPFDGLPVTVTGNKAKERFISEAESQKILEACPNAQWRLIFSLCRHGGLRCPSEVLGLTWADILRDQNKIFVKSPKTAHLKGRDRRIIPLFPELEKPLQEVFDEAPEGSVHVITRYRSSSQNLRTELNRIVKRAGVVMWQKPFQILRSTRETELMESYPAHVVFLWIGNSEAVAREHYLQVTDTHFEKAVGKKVAHSVAQQDSV